MQYCEVVNNVSGVKVGLAQCLATYIPTMTSSSIFADEFRLRTWSATIDEAALSLARENF